MINLQPYSTYIITIIAGLVLVSLSYWAGRRSRNEKLAEASRSWWQGFSTEMAGALFTTVLMTLVFNIIQNIESDRSLTMREQDSLIFQMGSQSNDLVNDAVRQLRWNGWTDILANGNFENSNLTAVDLSNFYLAGAKFINAHLDKVNFKEADLSAVILDGANLDGANFTDANLSNVDFRKAKNMREAIWIGANLTTADFHGLNLNDMNFTNAILNGTDFSGANLSNAIFDGANLADAIFDENTTLPEGYENLINNAVVTTS